ncbi:tRNA (adenosine(37)-N6)-dimethylallyltransferase MiaA [Adlercreutzia sp. ZJ141]|uniref:tRNA (adenosine(37)-N6)-dimethylallyltransferase MiaA n=1 Tax=Adlercreutzia sp. ZJ141 TaxID=2709406 RepID=UPI0013EDC38D|nr:tRNA (adenosine(37)-N6)-dimethylallyltransferase MiaA [Adlercreutzia sp. ZJ141]
MVDSSINILNLTTPVICVVGPTASGKTDLAQAIAQHIDGEVVSADSMQIYRGMDIGTGKIPEVDRVVAHHGFDIADPGEPFSAALFQTYARERFVDISSRGKRVVLCGGTGFYVRATIDGYEFPKGEQQNNPTRECWMEFARKYGAHALWEQLCERDEESARIIAPNDVKRVVRAFELLDEGLTYAQQKTRLASIPQVVPATFIGLAVTPDILRTRIDARVDTMVERGLVEEVTCLLKNGFRDGITSPQAIGYKEIVDALDGRITLEEAIISIKTATRRYAKRQRTWFRKDSRIRWINADDGFTDALLTEALHIVASMDATYQSSENSRKLAR